MIKIMNPNYVKSLTNNNHEIVPMPKEGIAHKVHYQIRDKIFSITFFNPFISMTSD